MGDSAEYSRRKAKLYSYVQLKQALTHAKNN